VKIEEQNIATMMIQINGLSPFFLNDIPPAEKTAILILPGPRDHSYREEQGIRIWKKNKLAKYLLVAGTNESPAITIEDIRGLCGVSTGFSNLFFCRKAKNTKEQMEWALSMLENYIPTTVEHIIVSTAAYHAPRCFLTFLASVTAKDKRLIISCLPVYNPEKPDTDYFGLARTGNTGIEGELKRIIEYQKNGDVASLDDYLNYLKWRLAQ